MKLKNSQISVMLDHLGVPMREQPKIGGERLELLNAIRINNPSLYNEAYNLIVLKLVPESANSSQLVTHRFMDILEDDIERFKKNTSIRIDREVNSNLDFTMSASRKDIENSAKAVLLKVNELNKDRYLLKDELTEYAKKAIDKASNQYKKISVQVNNEKPKILNFVAPKEFDSLVELAAERKNILMVGPAGCGKTFIASKIAESLGLDYASQSCTAGMSESALSGWLLPIGAGGRFEYVSSEFVRIYTKGGVFLFDEIDAADPNVLIFVNQAIANGHFFLPQRHKEPLIKKHRNFVAVAAANTFGNGADMQYVGRNQLDAATLDRFKIGTVIMDYDDRVESSLINPEALEWGNKIRSKIKNSHLNRIMSTRVMIDASDMINGQNWNIDDINRSYFSDWSTEEKSILGLT